MARQYKATSIKVEENLGKVGVLSSWFSKANTGTFTFENDPTSHAFCPVSNYAFVLCLTAVLRQLRVRHVMKFKA